jgi:rubrerythrin
MSLLSDSPSAPTPLLRRRGFLQVAGASAATAALALAGCGDDPEVTPANPNLVSLGTGDAGLLNYALLLEQLEAAFYQKVVDAPPADLMAYERSVFADLRDHEVIHRETLRFVLGNDALPNISFDFSSLTLTTRAGVLEAAKKLEDLGVAAYSGAARLFTNTGAVSFLAKISSVEARHAAFVRDLITPGTFAGDDVVVTDGALTSVAQAKTPVQVLAEAAPFFQPLIISSDSLPKA